MQIPETVFFGLVLSVITMAGVVALAFRSMTNTLIRMNAELAANVVCRQEADKLREAQADKIHDLTNQVKDLTVLVAQGSYRIGELERGSKEKDSDIAALRKENLALTERVATLEATIVLLEKTVAARDKEIKDLKSDPA